MKYVSDTLTFSRLSDDEANHVVTLPMYHRASVGVFPGTRVFAVPLPRTNEIVLTPIDPVAWGDLWRLEATVRDVPGAAKKLVEPLVASNVNILVHEGVSESTEDGPPVHQVFEILDLSKYANEIDGTTTERNSVEKPLLKPNRLINQLIANAQDVLAVDRVQGGWELRLERMEFFFRNKDARRDRVELNLNVDKEVYLPTRLLRRMPFVHDGKAPLPLHIISDTEQKYVNLRVLSPDRYYLLIEVEHDERVGAIDEFMRVLHAHKANMIDSYSRLKRVAETALFYALAEFSSKTEPDVVEALAMDLVAGEMTRAVVFTGEFGAGPRLEDLNLPPGATFRDSTDEQPSLAVHATRTPDGALKDELGPKHHLGMPYYARFPDASRWTLNSAEVFMAVPFSDAYAPFYRDCVKAAVLDAGLTPVRVDELAAEAGLRPIIERIQEGVARSRFVIADLSGWNSNVIYEVGLAYGISKPILLLCEEKHFQERSIPFDFAPYPLIKYSLGKSTDFRAGLTTRIHQIKARTEALQSAA